jgi:plasmid maintenance system antidote protein VapI
MKYKFTLLKELMETNKIKPTELAEICKVTKATIYNWLNLRYEIPAKSYEILSDYFKISIKDLINNKRGKNK